MSIYHTKTEESIYTAIAHSLEFMGYEIVRIRVFNGAKPVKVQVMLERVDGQLITVDDCAQASHQISSVMDVENMISSRYDLEVSSPGLNRPLTREKDYKAAIGKVAKIVLNVAIENRRNFTGIIKSVEDGVATIAMDVKEVNININDVDEAYLQFFETERLKWVLKFYK